MFQKSCCLSLYYVNVTICSNGLDDICMIPLEGGRRGQTKPWNRNQHKLSESNIYNHKKIFTTAFHYYLPVRELRASSSSCRIHRLAKNCSYTQWPSKNQSNTAENTKNYMEARKTCLIFHKIKNQTITKKA